MRYITPQTTALHLHDYAGILRIGTHRFRLEPGDFTLTPAGVASHYDLDDAGEHLCVHVEHVPPAGELMNLPLHWRPGVHQLRLREQMQSIIELRRRSEGSSEDLPGLAAGTALQSLLLWVAVMAGQAHREGVTNRTDDVLHRVREHLDTHFRESLDAPALARRFEVSQNYLARRFRERHGMTMQGYLLNRRVELARHLLAATMMPLKAVAIEAGFGNPQYFHRQFRRVTGYSPSEERLRGAGKRGE